MKAYLIDPFARTVTQVEYSGDYKEISALIGCQLFDAVRIGANGDTIFVDDEGLLNGPTEFFKHSSYPSPLAGKGLVLGTDDEGESVGTLFRVSPDEIVWVAHSH
jgi:hypothetical protein